MYQGEMGVPLCFPRFTQVVRERCSQATWAILLYWGTRQLGRNKKPKYPSCRDASYSKQEQCGPQGTDIF